MYSVCTEPYYKNKLYGFLLSCSLNSVFDWNLFFENQGIQFIRQLPIPLQDPL